MTPMKEITINPINTKWDLSTTGQTVSTNDEIANKNLQPQEASLQAASTHTSEIAQNQFIFATLMDAAIAYQRTEVTLPKSLDEERIEIKEADDDVEEDGTFETKQIQPRNGCLSKPCCLALLRCMTSTIKSLRKCCSRAKM